MVIILKLDRLDSGHSIHQKLARTHTGRVSEKANEKVRKKEAKKEKGIRLFLFFFKLNCGVEKKSSEPSRNTRLRIHTYTNPNEGRTDTIELGPLTSPTLLYDGFCFSFLTP